MYECTKCNWHTTHRPSSSRGDSCPGCGGQEWSETQRGRIIRSFSTATRVRRWALGPWRKAIYALAVGLLILAVVAAAYAGCFSRAAAAAHREWHQSCREMGGMD